MILVQRKFIIFLMLFTTILFGFGGYASWSILMQSAAMDPLRLKYLAEQILFIAILSVFVNISSFLFILIKSFYFSRELTKQVKLSRSSNYSPTSALRKLGKTGAQIAEILYELNVLSEKKSIKIGSLHALSTALLNLNEKKMIILSSRGIIQYVGEVFLKESGLQKSECEGKPIDSVLAFPDIIEEVAKIFDTAEEIHNKEKGYLLSPVLNHKKIPVFVLCVFEKRITDFVDLQHSLKKSTVQDRLGSFFEKSYSDLSSFFSRKKNRKEKE